MNYWLCWSKKIAKKYKPKLIIAGASAYSSKIDFKLFKESLSNRCIFIGRHGSLFRAIAGKCYPDPLPFADVCTSTTHKTLRGPRGGIILSNNEELEKK